MLRKPKTKEIAERHVDGTLNLTARRMHVDGLASDVQLAFKERDDEIVEALEEIKKEPTEMDTYDGGFINAIKRAINLIKERK